MARDPDRAAERIAAQQHSLITYLQARHRAGLSKRQIQWQVKTKRWRRLHTGVYAAAGARETWQQSLLAAVLAVRTEAVRQTSSGHRLEEVEDAAASGLSALWQHGCRRMGKPPKHEVLVVHKHRRTVKGTVVHRTRTLPSEDITTADGIPTVARPRLCVELCGRIPDTDDVATVDETPPASSSEAASSESATPCGPSSASSSSSTVCAFTARPSNDVETCGKTAGCGASPTRVCAPVESEAHPVWLRYPRPARRRATAGRPRA